jgi:hypothetical protein
MKQNYIDFQNALKEEFFKLRPSFTLSADTPLELLAVDPIFKKLIILDRTTSDKDTFEAGYLLWEHTNRDFNVFFDLFKISLKDNNLTLVIQDDISK